MRSRHRVVPALCVGLLAACVSDPTSSGIQACPDPTHSTEGWDLVSNNSFSFRKPPTFASDPERANRYRFSTTYFQWEWVPPGQRATDPPPDMLSYTSCRATVDGRPALIEVGTLSNVGNTTGARYYAAATWLNVPRRDGVGSGQTTSTANLLFQIYSNDPADREQIIASVFSVEFVDENTGAPAPVDGSTGNR